MIINKEIKFLQIINIPTATAEVIILIGPPIKHPITPKRTRRVVVGKVFAKVPYSAKNKRQGTTDAVKVAITQALLFPKISDIVPTNIPPIQ